MVDLLNAYHTPSLMHSTCALLIIVYMYTPSVGCVPRSKVIHTTPDGYRCIQSHSNNTNYSCTNFLTTVVFVHVSFIILLTIVPHIHSPFFLTLFHPSSLFSLSLHLSFLSPLIPPILPYMLIVPPPSSLPPASPLFSLPFIPPPPHSPPPCPFPPLHSSPSPFLPHCSLPLHLTSLLSFPPQSQMVLLSV